MSMFDTSSVIERSAKVVAVLLFAVPATMYVTNHLTEAWKNAGKQIASPDGKAVEKPGNGGFTPASDAWARRGIGQSGGPPIVADEHR